MREFKHADAGTALVWSAADQTQRKKSGGADGGEKSAAEGSGGQKKIAKRGEELIKRILMNEPLKGTKFHVEQLLDQSPTVEELVRNLTA